MDLSENKQSEKERGVDSYISIDKTYGLGRLSLKIKRFLSLFRTITGHIYRKSQGTGLDMGMYN